MTTIHPTATVAAGAQLDTDVEIGPFCVVDAHVIIGRGTRVGPHCVLTGHTTIGQDCNIAGFAAIGGTPQDKKYAGEPTTLVIGDRNTIREFTTFNTGTVQGTGTTRIGHDNWIMAYVHVAHDCKVGNHTIFANNAQLAGHVEVQDWVMLGGFTVVHQFVRIGEQALTAMGTILLQDLPPFVTAAGNPAKPFGINAEGLRRREFSAIRIAAVKQGFKTVYRNGLRVAEACALLEQRAAELQSDNEEQAAQDVICFSRFVAQSTRGILR